MHHNVLRIFRSGIEAAYSPCAIVESAWFAGVQLGSRTRQRWRFHFDSATKEPFSKKLNFRHDLDFATTFVFHHS